MTISMDGGFHRPTAAPAQHMQRAFDTLGKLRDHMGNMQDQVRDVKDHLVGHEVAGKEEKLENLVGRLEGQAESMVTRFDTMMERVANGTATRADELEAAGDVEKAEEVRARGEEMLGRLEEASGKAEERLNKIVEITASQLEKLREYQDNSGIVDDPEAAEPTDEVV